MIDVDPALVRACQRGEPGALDALVRATYSDVYALCRRMLPDAEEAADATQEVFLRVMRSVVGFRGESAFGTWLHRVAVNVCLTALKQRSRRRASGAAPGTQPFAVPGDPVGDRIPSLEDSPADRAVTTDLVARSESALGLLPEDARAVVVLRDIEGMPTRAVADVLGVSENVVKVRLFRAHARLRRMISEEPQGRGRAGAAGNTGATAGGTQR